MIKYKIWLFWWVWDILHVSLNKSEVDLQNCSIGAPQHTASWRNEKLHRIMYHGKGLHNEDKGVDVIDSCMWNAAGSKSYSTSHILSILFTSYSISLVPCLLFTLDFCTIQYSLYWINLVIVYLWNLIMFFIFTFL